MHKPLDERLLGSTALNGDTLLLCFRFPAPSFGRDKERRGNGITQEFRHAPEMSRELCCHRRTAKLSFAR